MKLPQVLSEGFLRAMPPEERAKLGTAGMTQAECEKVFVAGQEKELQLLVAKWLRLHEHYYVRPRMDKKTTTPLGTPDFIACINGRFVAIETKTVKGSLSTHQVMRMAEVCHSKGAYLVIRSLQDLLTAAKDL